MFLLALALIGLQTFLLNGRWELIMRSLGVSLDWMAGWRILMISLWFNQALPSSAGGDVVRIWLLRQLDVPWSQAVKGVIADRFTALIGLVALMVVGLPLLLSRVSDHAAILAIGGLTVAGVVGTAVLLTLDRWPKRIITLRPDRKLRSIRILCQIPAAAIQAARTALWISASHPSHDGGCLLRTGGWLEGKSVHS